MGTRFGFGQNWQSFLDELDDDRVRRAQTDLQETFNIEDFAGKSFLDIGCGSGLFSLAAHRLGAQEVFSFDYDANAVDCCRSLHSQEGDTTWEVQRGDLLDDEFMNSLGKYEYVYCWGVAHHTGALWDAIDNATIPVKRGGLLCLGIYNKVGRDESVWNSQRALQVKKLYHSLPSPLQTLMVLSWGTAHLGGRTLVKRESPIRYLREYRSNRGMDYWHDIRDWLGGLPFEFATSEEVTAYLDANHDSFELVSTDIAKNLPTAVNVYVFERS